MRKYPWAALYEVPPHHQGKEIISDRLGICVCYLAEMIFYFKTDYKTEKNGLNIKQLIEYGYFLSRNLRKQRPQIRLNLVISLTLAQVAFLAGIDASEYMVRYVGNRNT